MDTKTIIDKHKKEFIIIFIVLFLISVMLMFGGIGDTNDVINPTISTPYAKPYVSPSLTASSSGGHYTATTNVTTTMQFETITQLLDAFTFWMPIVLGGVFLFTVWRAIKRHNNF